MAENEPTGGGSKPLRTRKDQILYASSLAVLLSIGSYVWDFRSDIDEIIKVRIDAITAECRASLAEERARAQLRELQLETDIRELRENVLRGRR